MMEDLKSVVIVAGAQRSGTTLVGQILGAHPEAFLIDEPDGLYKWFDAKISGKAAPDLDREVLEKANGKYLDEAARVLRADGRLTLAPQIGHLVLKAPNLTHRSADFARLGVPVSVVIPVRDPRAVVASMGRFRHQDRTMVDRQIERLSTEDGLAGADAGELALLRDETQPFHVRGALIWRMKFKLIEQIRAAGCRPYVFRYEDLVADHERIVSELAQHAGLSMAPEMMAHESAYKGFGPGYTDRQRPLDTMSLDSWRSRLDPGEAEEIAKVARSEMEALGYLGEGAEAATPVPADDDLRSPVILVGRGGSGTRLLSELAQQGGIFLGNRINKYGDSVEWADLIYEMALVSLPSPDRPKPTRAWDGPLCDRAKRILEAGNRKPGQPWGWKLPETMLVMSEVCRTFPNGKVVHLIRHPVTSSLRRTHKTSRPEDQIGRLVVPAAYEHVGLRRKAGASDEEWRRNAVTWRFQVEKVMEFGRRELGPDRYIEVRYEDLCADPVAAWRRISDFLGIPFIEPTQVQVDPGRMGQHAMSDPRVAEIWRLCGGVAEELGYQRPEGHSEGAAAAFAGSASPRGLVRRLLGLVRGR